MSIDFKMIVSIIIPAYDIQDYLAECLNSIICQSIPQLEIIIVNDGSNDNTGQTADGYVKKYNFIKVIHQRKQGVSAARNNGLLQAIGDYIWFVDGDDLLVLGAISILHQHIKKYQPDAIFFDHETFIDGYIPNNDLKFLSKKSYSGCFNSYFPNILRNREIFYSPCDKIIRRNIILDFKVSFKEFLISAEDYYWCFEVMQHIDNIVHIDQIFYLYRKNRIGSATTTISKEHLYSALTALEQSIEEIAGFATNAETQRNYLLYSSQLFFYNLPEFYKAGLLNANFEKRFKVVYEIYRANQVDLSLYNRGAKVFNQLYSLLSWSHAVRLYSRLILTRRYIQLTIAKNK